MHTDGNAGIIAGDGIGLLLLRMEAGLLLLVEDWTREELRWSALEGVE